MQISFMYILKIYSKRTVKISGKNVVKITVENIGLQNVLNCQITSKCTITYNIFPQFCKIFLLKFS